MQSNLLMMAVRLLLLKCLSLLKKQHLHLQVLNVDGILDQLIMALAMLSLFNRMVTVLTMTLVVKVVLQQVLEWNASKLINSSIVENNRFFVVQIASDFPDISGSNSLKRNYH